MGSILTCQRGESEHIRGLENDDDIEKISICSDISELTELSDIYFSFDETMELIEESMDINGVITTKKYYNTLQNLRAVDVAY